MVSRGATHTVGERPAYLLAAQNIFVFEDGTLASAEAIEARDIVPELNYPDTQIEVTPEITFEARDSRRWIDSLAELGRRK